MGHNRGGALRSPAVRSRAARPPGERAVVYLPWTRAKMARELTGRRSRASIADARRTSSPAGALIVVEDMALSTSRAECSLELMRWGCLQRVIRDSSAAR